MTFNEIYPDFETFKNKINTVFEDTVQSTDEIFYVFIKNQFGKRNFLSADENFIQSKIFENWQILKQKWVKLLEINKSSVEDILKQQTETETYKGNLTEIGTDTKKFLDTGGSSNFTPAVITAIGRVIDLPNIYKSIGTLFQSLFFNIRAKSNGSSSTPKVEYTSELELSNPQKESFPRGDGTFPTFQNEVNEIFKKEIQALIDGGGGADLPQKIEWLDNQLETLPNATDEVFLNAVFIYYIKNGQKLFLATTILMLLDEVETNSNNIAGNSSDIVDLESNVAGLVSQLNALESRLTEAESDISDNEILINENTASIQTIAGKTYIFEIIDNLNEQQIFRKIESHTESDRDNLVLFRDGDKYTIREYVDDGNYYVLEGFRFKRNVFSTLRFIAGNTPEGIQIFGEETSSIYTLNNFNYSQAFSFVKSLGDKKRQMNFEFNSKIYRFGFGLDDEVNGYFYLFSRVTDFTVDDFFSESISNFFIRLEPTSTNAIRERENVQIIKSSYISVLLPFTRTQQSFNYLLAPLVKPFWPLEFYQNGQLSVIDDLENPVSRYTFNNFSAPRFDKGGEVGFTFSADLEINTPVQEPKLTLALESIFKFTNATWNSKKFVPVVALTSPSGKIFSTHSIYKKGSLDYHYIHIFLSGFANIPNALDDERGEWIIHFKLHHKSKLSTQTRQIQTKNVKSKEDLFFEKMKDDYEIYKKNEEQKNAKSRLN